MKSWEELKGGGIAAARAAIAEAQNGGNLAAAFAAWWKEQRSPDCLEHVPVHTRPSTLELAEALGDAGLADLADFSVVPWVAAGPIHPGVWGFSLLLGETFVAEFIEDLTGGGSGSAVFYGLESFGAWDAFESELAIRLRADERALAAALNRLRRVVEQTNSDPNKFIERYGINRGNIKDRVSEYIEHPSIDEAREHPFDPPVMLDFHFLWPVLLEIEPAEMLALLGELPHPSFVRTCLREERLSKQPALLAELVKSAPSAFDEKGFRREGAVVVLLLEIGGAAIRKSGLEADGSICVAPVTQPELLTPAIDLCKQTAAVLLDALLTRPDAVALAWAWLDRFITAGKLRGRWRSAGAETRVLTANIPTLFIAALAERLSWRSDWSEWVRERDKLWRIYRAAAVFAVGKHGPEADARRLATALEDALINLDLEYAQIVNAVGDKLDVVAAVGGSVISGFDSPGDWFEAAWQKLRPVRERNWRVGEGGLKQNSAGELLVFWGLSAHEFLPESERQRFWNSLEKAVRDACQTDTFGYAPFWSSALLRLFSYFPVGGDGGEKRLALALLPYIAADHRFLTLVISLRDQGWTIDVIRDAVAIAGFSLKDVVHQFLGMKELVFGLKQANRIEIAKFRALAEALG